MERWKQSSSMPVKIVSRFLLIPAIILLLILLRPNFVEFTQETLGMAAAINSRPVTLATLNDVKYQALDESESIPSTLPWNIHFWAVPLGDDSLHIFTGQTTQLNAMVNADVEVGGAPKERFVMTYDSEESAYEAVAADILIPGSSTVEGSVGLSAELNSGETLDTGPIDFRRFYVPTTGAPPIVSNDNLLEMIITNNSLPAAVYVVVMPMKSLPGPPPLGYQLVGQPYSVRASGAIVESSNPMSLKMFYTDTTLGGLDPHTLSVLQWDPVAGRWDDLGGTLHDLIENSVTTATERFTVYALMATTRWSDDFNDFTGLSVRENTTVLLPDGELVLDGSSLTGVAVSHLITPPIPIDTWATLTFTRTVPAGTILTIDVLDAQDNPLLTNVTSGTSLATIDPATHPSLKLRANFATNDMAKTPRLDKWRLDWAPAAFEIYLSFVVKR